MKKIKNILVIATFFSILVIFSLAQLSDDNAISKTERRKLKQKPQFSIEAFLNEDYSTNFEEYLLDQFIFRDKFRNLQAQINFNLWQHTDSNNIVLVDDSAIKLEPTLDIKQVEYASELFNKVIANYLSNNNIYYAIVPDKSYFLQDKTYPTMDYDKLQSIMQNTKATYLNLFNLLSLEDYYKTDAHWKQENIYKVAQYLAQEMNVSEYLTQENEYTHSTLENFYGVYMGHAALPLKADNIIYAEDEHTKNAIVTSAEVDGTLPVYTLDKFSGLDGYDVFLNGAQAIMNIEIPTSKSDKELIIFRDSYTSSLTPYLLGAYKNITLIDLRYANSNILADYVDFNNQDVLFLYSTTLLNTARIMR